ncbi:MAG: response regulator [Spirochaetota bacterium]
MPKATILVIDDDADIVEGMRILLESNGYAVLKAYEYANALTQARTASPAVIILDAMLMLNDTPGLNFPLDIRRSVATAHIPIFMITALDSADSDGFNPGTEDEQVPIDAFEGKPVNPDVLLKKLDELVRMNRSPWAEYFALNPK